MATITHGSKGRTDVSSRTAPDFKNTGVYNKITKVPASTMMAFTGSNAAAAFICEVVTNVTVEAVNGGQIPGTSLTADTLYPIAPKKVTIGSDGIVYVLHT